MHKLGVIAIPPKREKQSQGIAELVPS